MNGKDGKRSKGRRNLYSHSRNLSTNAVNLAAATDSSIAKPFQPFGSGVTINVNDVATEFGLTLKSPPDDAERITELMDAPVDLDIPIPAHAISRGPNPYLDKCMYCETPRSSAQDGDDGLELVDLPLDGNTMIGSFADPQSFSSLKLEIWTCANCRKVAGNVQSFLEANFPQTVYDLPFLHDKSCMDPLSCAKCQEERENHTKDTEDLKACWVELRSFVTDLYNIDELVPTEEQGERVRYLVDRLCSQDPHQLFLRLESLIREMVMEIKAGLLVKLKENGYDTPELALDFTSTLLNQYEKLTRKAHIFAQYLGAFSEHLRRFKVTWELLNKHLFHSIAHNDPAISNSGPTILEQLRQGSVHYEKSKDDPYCSVRKRLLKFQEEMSVVVVVWRDCQQLIESYCQQEVKNTQKQVSSKARSFISQQRQFLKEQLMKEPLMDEALSETMKNLMAGHKSATERVRCPRCKRERCTCDECTITHMITCGIINSDRGEMAPPTNSFNFALDHTRNVMDITPPSMSSTTSSSGSVSPINIDDKLTFYECDRVLNSNRDEFREEFSDALLSCDTEDSSHISRNSANDDGNAGDDEDEGDDDLDDFPDNQDAGSDEPHALQIPICELKDADALWEAVQQHQQQQLIQQQQQLFASQHSCNHCQQAKQDQLCPFQPRIHPELSRQLDEELAKSGLLPGGLGDGGSDAEATNADNTSDNQSNGDNSANPGLCATCQCHACLKQSGHMISTSLPLQMPVSPPPAELHLYPHIHGLPPQHQQRYMLDLPSPLLPSIKLPVKLDFDDTSGIQDHISYAYSDWDNTMQPRPGSLAAQHHHQLHQRHSSLATDPLPPPLATSNSPFTFDLASHLATHTTHTSTTNTASAFKSVAGKPMASSILPTLNNIGTLNSEGSSVDPTKPLDFTSQAKMTQSCANSVTSIPSTSFSPLSFSCPSSTQTPSTSVPGVPVSTVASKAGSMCHGPPCSRPTPVGGNVTSSKWERNHPQHCRKFGSGSSHLSKQMAGTQGQHPQHNVGVLPFTGAMQGPPPLPPTPATLKNFFPKRPSLPCTHAANQLPRSAGLPPHSAPASSASSTTTTTTAMPTTGGASIPLSCSNSLSTMVNNIGVGTSNPCTDPECDAHHQEDNCDSVDDSCSEKSSSTSTSNQKEGKYCDCCYCEFFGHNNTQVAKTSTNYIEMKDRLRKKLKKRSENKHKQGNPRNGMMQEGCREDQDPLEKKGLEALLSYINGTDSHVKVKEKEQTAKAAKRARQKQKKLEEKARQEKSNSPSKENCYPEPQKTLRQLIMNQTLNLGTQPGLDPKNAMAKSRAKKLQSVPGAKTFEEENRDTAPSPTRKEISCSSSLIIESTRPTISVASKDSEKHATSQQKLHTGNNTKETPSHMIHILSALQSLGQQQQQQQQQQNKNKSSNCTSVINSASASSQAKSNGIILQGAKPPKSSSEDAKVSGVSKLEYSSPQKQQQPTQQPKQHQSTKSINGKVSRSSGNTSHVTANGKSSVDKNGETQYMHMNGGPLKSQAMPTVTSLQQPVPNSSSGLSSSVKKSVADSPGAGSGSSASQSPSCGTKASADQGKTSSKAKKNKKKNKNGDISGVDEIFMPKSEAELEGDVDDFERELEEFKRFCFEPAEPKERRKIAVNVNLKDIFKKKTGMV